MTNPSFITIASEIEENKSKTSYKFLIVSTKGSGFFNYYGETLLAPQTNPYRLCKTTSTSYRTVPSAICQIFYELFIFCDK